MGAIITWACDGCPRRLDANPRDYRLGFPTEGPDDTPAAPQVAPAPLADQVARAQRLGWQVTPELVLCPDCLEVGQQ